MLTNPLHPEGDDDHDVRSHANSAEFVSNDFEGWSSTYFDVYESAVNLVEQIGQSQNYFDNGGGASIGTVEAKHGIEDYGQGSDFDEVDLLHNVKQDLARTGMNVKKSRQLECNSEAGDFTFCSGISENVEPPQSSFTEDRDKDPTHHPSKIPRNQGVESDLPSVERRRRRRNNQKNLYSSPTRYSSVHRDLDSVGTDFSRGKKWTELGNWGLVILLVFLIVFTVQQDKIIHDIKQYHRRRNMMYSQSNNSLIEKIRRIPEISSIFVTYTLLFPTCELVKTIILLLHQLYLIITNPFGAPRIISHIFWAGFENVGLVLNQMQRGMRTLSSPFIRVLGFDLLVGTDDPFGHGDDFEYFDDDNHGGMASTAINGGYQQGSFRPLSNNLPLSVGVGGIPELERVDSCKNVSHGNTNGNSFDFAGSERLKEIDVISNGDSVRDDKCGFKSTSGTSAGNAKPVKRPNKVESNAIHSRVARYDAEGLNPAFLTEEEYPPGWLMYHPKHGVITREKLIEFERH